MPAASSSATTPTSAMAIRPGRRIERHDELIRESWAIPASARHGRPRPRVAIRDCASLSRTARRDRHITRRRDTLAEARQALDAAFGLAQAARYNALATRGSSSVVEHLLAKEGVASSNLVSRSSTKFGRTAESEIWANRPDKETSPCALQLAACIIDP